MNKYLTRLLVLGAILSAAMPMAYSQDPPRKAAESAKVGYYFIAKAEVNAGAVYVSGATNLPAGAVLAVAILTHIGQGGERVNEENTEIMVDKNGLFSTALPPRKGAALRRNMVCVLSFHPNLQTPRITKIVGERGERLGDPTTNPEIGTYSGGYYLVSHITVIGAAP